MSLFLLLLLEFVGYFAYFNFLWFFIIYPFFYALYSAYFNYLWFFIMYPSYMIYVVFIFLGVTGHSQKKKDK